MCGEEQYDGAGRESVLLRRGKGRRRCLKSDRPAVVCVCDRR